MPLDLREALRRLSEKKLLIEVDYEVNKEYEVAAISSEFEKERAILFKRVSGSNIPIVSGVYGDRRRLAISLGMGEKEFFKHYMRAIDTPSPTEIIKSGPVQEISYEGKNVNINMLPIPKVYEKDAGPYLTASIIIAKDPETGVPNASYHRMLPISNNKFAVRVVERDLWHYIRKAGEVGKKLEAVVVIGVDPATAIAASTTVEIDVNELEIASTILGEPLTLTKGKKVNVEYPAYAEIAIEGFFDPDEKHPEGPFVDLTGTYDVIRNEPVFTVKAIYTRREPIFQFILSAGSEHKTLMGLPREVKIHKYASAVSPVEDVYMTSAGFGWFEAVISIRKRHKDEPIDVGLAAFAAHPSMKKVIIVDPDINIRDYEEVNWAVLTRANPATDYIVIPRSKGSSLDKSGDPRSKIIIDATIKGDPKPHEKGKIPTSERVEEIIRKIKRVS